MSETYVRYRPTCGLIVVPGALSTSSSYSALAAELANDYTVHIIERRGRGRSGPMGEGYSMASECQDVEALRALTETSFMFGHSYGGLITLEKTPSPPSTARKSPTGPSEPAWMHSPSSPGGLGRTAVTTRQSGC
jgi:alpha-beta hydrolase superfamily lysophospholipase